METTKECLVCKKTTQEIPLTSFEYMDNLFYICPQHIPVLIHSPHKLIDLLPGAENFEGGRP